MNEVFPNYDDREIFADGVIHVLGICASAVGVIFLMVLAIGAKPPLTVLWVAIYCVGLVTVFVCSAAYNLVHRPDLKAILRRFDHAAIYLKVATTYTPFAMIKMGGWPASLLMFVVWGIALFGLTNKLLFPAHLVRLSYGLYLTQGWAAVLVLKPMSEALSPSILTLLVIGGALYTIGVVFHLWEKLHYNNAIWHGFVLAASTCHYAAVLGVATQA